MGVRRLIAATTLCYVLASGGPAAAQPAGAFLVGSNDRIRLEAQSAPRQMQFRAPQGDLRAPGEQAPNGLIAAFPVRDDIQIGVGRYVVPQIAGPRTYVETDRQPASVRSRDRGIAAVGVSFRF